MSPDTPKLKAIDHESYWTLSIVSFIVPIVGLVLGIIYLTKSERIDRKLGEHLVAISILFMIIETAAYFLLMAASASYSVMN